MRRLKKALSAFRLPRDSWAWGTNPWILSAALLLPVGRVLPLGRLARARVSTRRSRNFYSS